MNPLTLAIADMAVRLIAAGGVYQHKPLDEVLLILTEEIGNIEDWLSGDDECPGCPDCTGETVQ